jgi:hypothetical protein
MEPFVLDSENMREDKPTCMRCKNPEVQNETTDVDFERWEAKSMIAKNTGRALDEITETEIETMVQLRRLHMNKP